MILHNTDHSSLHSFKDRKSVNHSRSEQECEKYSIRFCVRVWEREGVKCRACTATHVAFEADRCKLVLLRMSEEGQVVVEKEKSVFLCYASRRTKQLEFTLW